MTRATLIDALALAMLFALAIVAYHLLPGEAFAASDTTDAADPWPLVFILGILIVCAAWTVLERLTGDGADHD